MALWSCLHTCWSSMQKSRQSALTRGSTVSVGGASGSVSVGCCCCCCWAGSALHRPRRRAEPRQGRLERAQLVQHQLVLALQDADVHGLRVAAEGQAPLDELAQLELAVAVAVEDLVHLEHARRVEVQGAEVRLDPLVRELRLELLPRQRVGLVHVALHEEHRELAREGALLGERRVDGELVVQVAGLRRGVDADACEDVHQAEGHGENIPHQQAHVEGPELADQHQDVQPVHAARDHGHERPEGHLHRAEATVELLDGLGNRDGPLIASRAVMDHIDVEALHEHEAEHVDHDEQEEQRGHEGRDAVGERVQHGPQAPDDGDGPARPEDPQDPDQADHLEDGEPRPDGRAGEREGDIED
mmetsp:Transcript_112649/g.319059  ORF Transcript_112649/g.319059 Transcript_112649/m.319059 type:complete len:359 (+) Transcript_112649:601-1677(+)